MYHSHLPLLSSSLFPFSYFAPYTMKQRGFIYYQINCSSYIFIRGADNMKKIKVIELGGTISAHGKDRLDFKDYQSGVFQGKDFLKQIPEIQSIADVTFETFLRVS